MPDVLLATCRFPLLLVLCPVLLPQPRVLVHQVYAAALDKSQLNMACRFQRVSRRDKQRGISVNRNPDLAAVSNRARAVLEKAAGDLSQHIPPDKRPPAAMFSDHIWALSHGVVELFARNSPGTQSPFPPEDLLETGIGVYLRGLGLIPPDDDKR